MAPLSNLMSYLRGARYTQTQTDEGSAIQERIHHCLKQQNNNLTEYVDYLKTLTDIASDADDPTKDGLKVWAEVTLEGLERARMNHWLNFWLAYIDDDASDLGAVPQTREDVVEAVQSGKARFHQLDKVNDGLHRENAALMAQLFVLHGTLALLLDLDDLETLPMV